VAAQSAPLDGTVQDLIDDANALLENAGDDVPRPEAWAAWRLEPVSVEFWHGSRDRMHRRLQYRATDDGWTSGVLQP
jgi:pyridoxine/pyridoxamine 5'-phosphate oxidase